MSSVQRFVTRCDILNASAGHTAHRPHTLFYSNPSYPRGRRRCAQVVTCGPATRELEAPSPAVEEAAEGDATSSSAVSHADA